MGMLRPHSEARGQASVRAPSGSPIEHPRGTSGPTTGLQQRFLRRAFSARGVAASPSDPASPACLFFRQLQMCKTQVSTEMSFLQFHATSRLWVGKRLVFTKPKFFPGEPWHFGPTEAPSSRQTHRTLRRNHLAEQLRHDRKTTRGVAKIALT